MRSTVLYLWRNRSGLNREYHPLPRLANQTYSFAINKERSDIKTELDYAMRQLEQDSPFFKADLYKEVFYT